MSLAIVTGSAGLVGSTATRSLIDAGYDVWGIDNDQRRAFFGAEASTRRVRRNLESGFSQYEHFDIDIRDVSSIDSVFAKAGRRLSLIVHAAAQPSHDWAARNPGVDFSINATGTLNLLEATRRESPEAVFVFVSTNKVYGDTPNNLPFREHETRFDLPEGHEWFGGIPESMSIDRSTHSLFGVSKASADLLVQEYGRYFGMATACFRGGCLTGPGHAGTELHGFLAYLMKCTVNGTPYTIFGYQGKQVRDNLHADDLVDAFLLFAAEPKQAAVYNIGGGRAVSCSILEAIEHCESIAGRSLHSEYSAEHRRGDHLWWISDTGRFRADFPDWHPRYGLEAILQEIHDENVDRWSGG